MIITTTKPMRKRALHDFYPTPLELCRAAVGLLPECSHPFRALDPGAGAGVWGQALKERYPQAGICGCELDTKQACAYPEAYASYFYADYLAVKPTLDFAVILGNPPYKQALEFVQKSFSLLCPGGRVLFLLRLAFLESQERYPFFQEHPPRAVWVCSRRPSFTGDTKTDATAYALYLWEQGYTGPTRLDWLLWEYEPGRVPLAVSEQMALPLESCFR